MVRTLILMALCGCGGVAFGDDDQADTDATVVDVVEDSVDAVVDTEAEADVSAEDHGEPDDAEPDTMDDSEPDEEATVVDAEPEAEDDAEEPDESAAEDADPPEDTVDPEEATVEDAPPAEDSGPACRGPFTGEASTGGWVDYWMSVPPGDCTASICPSWTGTVGISGTLTTSIVNVEGCSGVGTTGEWHFQVAMYSTGFLRVYCFSGPCSWTVYFDCDCEEV